MLALCVDPDDEARRATARAFEDAGVETRTATGVADARERVDRDVDAVVTEYDLPDGSGLDLVEHVRETVPDAACVLFTGTPLAAMDTDAFDGLVVEYLEKDADRAELVALVEHSVGFGSQTAYPLPQNEDARLAALDQYAADSAALATALDRLTELATTLFDTNSTAVGLVDSHHERFLSCHGASFDTLHREDTVCTYAILDESVTVVEDVAADPRFSENEGLAAAGVAFYAGAPLVTPEGHAIGTLCLHDDEPRSFSERDRELLSMLADEAMEQLELRRRLAENGGTDDD